ncbi:solute:Na+ symporter, SSS family [Tranquillimonas rosea]|uniref:Solute:Na+ symporter, SSS family n=1 Tax=Tranquillimonas rosea TaxID=641238 RepID=A0A1H9VYM8_9RHOB|nr:sodium:solute symporter [Tranquillimonas rosea]SES26393.1 solute:Na+ symporter, SSS family [Tranquillimonas rosea]
MEETTVQDVSQAITTLDLVVLALYFLVVIAIGVWVARRTKSGEDLFLAGRALTWGVVGFSLFASNISSTTLIGLTGAAYATGIATSAYEWMSGLPLIVLAFVFVPLFFRSRITTIPEYLERRFDRATRLYFSGVTILLTIIVDTAGGLYAGAVVTQSFFPDIPIWVTCVGIGLFAGLYTAGGGLRAVVYTDVMQAVVLIVGTTAMTLILFAELGWSWSNVVEQMPDPEQLSIVQPMSDEILPWPGLILGVPVLGFWYWVTNQYIVQRVLGARSLKDAQQGAILGGFLKILPMFIMVLPGAMAISIVPDLPNQDMVFPTLTSTVLPAGLTGVVLAGLIAAIMSSVDSTLNSSSTLVVHDFIKKDREEMDPTRARNYGRVTTLILMGVAILWAPFITNFGGLWQYLQQAFSILVPPVMAIFILGALWSRVTAKGAMAAFIGGHAIGLVLFVLTQMGVWPLHFTINIGLMVFVSVAILVGVSLMDTAPRREDLSGVIWRPSMAIDREASGGGLTDVRVLAAILGAAMLAILVIFW